MLLHAPLVHLVQRISCQLYILDQSITSAPREVFSDHNPHQLQLFTVRRHRICRHYPASLSQLMRNSKLIPMMTLGGVYSECYKG